MKYINYRVTDQSLKILDNQELVFVDRYDIQGQRDTDYNWETIATDLNSLEAAVIRAHEYASNQPGASVYYHGVGIEPVSHINIQEDK